MSTVDADHVLTLTPEARSIVLEALASEEQSSTLALWIEVTGVRAGGYSYDLYFAESVDADDATLQIDEELTVVIPAASVDRLRGARLEYASEGGAGLVLVNPNAPSPQEANPGVPAEVLAKGLDGALAQRAVEVL